MPNFDWCILDIVTIKNILIYKLIAHAVFILIFLQSDCDILAMYFETLSFNLSIQFFTLGQKIHNSSSLSSSSNTSFTTNSVHKHLCKKDRSYRLLHGSSLVFCSLLVSMFFCKNGTLELLL